MHDFESNGTKTALFVLTVAAAVGLALAGATMPATAQDGADSIENESNGMADDEDDDDASAETGTSDENVEECEAGIGEFDLHTADSVVDGFDDPARVGVSAETSITNECPVVMQITFNIPNDMYYQGTSAGSSGTGLQTEVFEVQPGDVASFTTNMYANQPGDRTVTADVEYFPEGQPDDARSLDGLMLSFDVEDPVPEEEWPNGPADINEDLDRPDAGGTNDGGQTGENDGGEECTGEGCDDNNILDAIANNLVVVLSVSGVILIGTVVAWKQKLLIFKS